MNARISYKLDYRPHPWNPVFRDQGVQCWCLVKVICPEFGNPTEEPVAIFNLDSEGLLFQGHLLSAGMEQDIIAIDDHAKQLLESIHRSRSRTE